MSVHMNIFVNWENLPSKYTTGEMIKALPASLLQLFLIEFKSILKG